MQLAFGFAPRPKILLSVFRDELEKQSVLAPVPSDDWFIMLFQSGEIEARKIGGRWFLYQDSAINWVRSLDQEAIAA